MLLSNKTVAIVGGGPGGLVLARILQLKGLNVKVYERDNNKDVRQQGATLDLHEESGLEAMRRANLINEFNANFRPNAGKIKILDQNTVVKMNDHEIESDTENSRPEIDRAPLREILIQSLNSDTIVWDSHFVSMEQRGDGWFMYFKNGSTAYADIRKYITDIKPIYSGITIVEGNVYDAAKNAPKLWELVQGGKIFALGNEQSIILSAKGDGSLSFYTGCKVEENWVKESGIDFSNKQQIIDWFKTTFASWSKQWEELFASDELWFVPRPQYHFPLDQTWTSLPNLTMLGDAAHRMPPYAGEGVNQAMQDAFELAKNLTNDQFNDMLSAIVHYEQQMQSRASQVTKDTLDSTELIHSANGLEQILQVFQQVRED